jgi:hypothetical protein
VLSSNSAKILPGIALEGCNCRSPRRVPWEAKEQLKRPAKSLLIPIVLCWQVIVTIVRFYPLGKDSTLIYTGCQHKYGNLSAETQEIWKKSAKELADFIKNSNSTQQS